MANKTTANTNGYLYSAELFVYAGIIAVAALLLTVIALIFTSTELNPAGIVAALAGTIIISYTVAALHIRHIINH